MQLTPNLLLNAYVQGIFPMAHEDGDIYWYDPDPRAILPLDGLHVPRRLKQRINRQPFEIKINSAFVTVMRACAETTSQRKETWISEEIIRTYTELHRHGYAHSVEAWQDGQLVGGLYGVAIRGLFAGESMFSRATDASKICLVYLVNHMRQQGFSLLDTQFVTDHLERFGVIQIARDEYKLLLSDALQIDAKF